MAQTTVKLLIDSEKNSITFSKNFRIFSTQDPVPGITEFTDFVEDLIYSTSSSIDLDNLTRSFRYSRNKLDWSLWYEILPGNIGDAANIFLNKDECYYFEVKYEYDDGTYTELESTIQINEIKLRFKQASTTPNTFTPIIMCSDEKCTSIITNRDPSFRPYEVDSAIGMYRELSFFTNQLYGHQVVYFRTLPESNSGDYIFKEWTLYKNVDRQCIKVAVPKNAFPSNAPKYADFGLDFQIPFEVHIDHKYFQSIFGCNSEPRKRDFLYFPLLNRMFEIQGSYLHRGFMMAPTFWKIQLKKYNPNIDMLLKDETRTFLDNVIMSSEELFSGEVEKNIKDATMPSQYSTISRTFDSSRRSLHPDISIKPLKFTFNFASLIDNYYDLSNIPPSLLSYELSVGSPTLSTNITLENLPSLEENSIATNNVVLAYQGSGLYAAWRNNAILTNDQNYRSTSTRFVRVRGPFDTIPDSIGQSVSGRYIRVEAYRDLSFKDQRDVLVDTVGAQDLVRFKSRDTAIVYTAQPKFNTTDSQNLSFTCLFNVPQKNATLNFIDGFDNESQTGIKIIGTFVKYFSSEPEGDLSLTVQINSQTKSYSIANFKSGDWHALVISISNEFKQIGAYVYEIVKDPSDEHNYSDFKPILNSIASLTTATFDLTQHYRLPASDLLITNLRVFNTMIKDEQHDFILSQQFIKDESMLILIDNSRPQINLPYIAKNR